MKSFNDKSKAAYNKMADHYNESPEGHFTQPFKEYLLEIMEHRNGDSVLDVACGNGTLLKMISAKKSINGFGVDISEEMVKNAARNCPGMTFKTAGCESIPFGDGSFDSITVCAAYHHFPDVKAFAKEAKRLLKPNGAAYIAEIYLPAALRILCNPFVPLMPDGDVRFYSSNEIVHTFERYAFRCTGVFRRQNIQIICLRKAN